MAEQQLEITAEVLVKVTMFTTHAHAVQAATHLTDQALAEIIQHQDRQEARAAALTVFLQEASLITQRLHAVITRRLQEALNRTARLQELTARQVTVHHPAEVTALPQEAVAVVEQRALLQEVRDNKHKRPNNNIQNPARCHNFAGFSFT